jgi:carboxyl-terminal processing protease
MISGSASIKPLGNVKVTTQKFYRINGESTQLNGLIPDIIMPDRYMFMDIGERQYDNALTWDKLDPLSYNQNVWVVKSKEKIINKSNKRIQSDTTMQKVMENAKRMKEYSDKTLVSLNLNEITRDAEQRKELNEYFDKYLNNEIPSIMARNIDSDLEYINIDSSRIVRNDEWLKNIRKDYQLQEAIFVIKDLNSHN